MTELGFASSDIESVLGHCEREKREAYAALFDEG